jgi:hypothetical protein
MFLGDSIIFWLFAICLVAGIGTMLVSLECMRKQVNRVLPDREKGSIQLPWPQSLKEAVLGTHILRFLTELLEQHRRHCPTSSLRKVFFISMISIIPSFIGFAISER